MTNIVGNPSQPPPAPSSPLQPPPGPSSATAVSGSQATELGGGFAPVKTIAATGKDKEQQHQAWIFVMFLALLLLVGPSLCLAVTRVEVVKSWSAVVTEVSIEHWWPRPLQMASSVPHSVNTQFECGDHCQDANPPDGLVQTICFWKLISATIHTKTRLLFVAT